MASKQVSLNIYRPRQRHDRKTSQQHRMVFFIRHAGSIQSLQWQSM